MGLDSLDDDAFDDALRALGNPADAAPRGGLADVLARARPMPPRAAGFPAWRVASAVAAAAALGLGVGLAGGIVIARSGAPSVGAGPGQAPAATGDMRLAATDPASRGAQPGSAAYEAECPPAVAALPTVAEPPPPTIALASSAPAVRGRRVGPAAGRARSPVAGQGRGAALAVDVDRATRTWSGADAHDGTVAMSVDAPAPVDVPAAVAFTTDGAVAEVERRDVEGRRGAELGVSVGAAVPLRDDRLAVAPAAALNARWTLGRGVVAPVVGARAQVVAPGGAPAADVLAATGVGLQASDAVRVDLGWAGGWRFAPSPPPSAGLGRGGPGSWVHGPFARVAIGGDDRWRLELESALTVAPTPGIEPDDVRFYLGVGATFGLGSANG